MKKASFSWTPARHLASTNAATTPLGILSIDGRFTSQFIPTKKSVPNCALGISPRDVRLVVLTHLHTDHAGGLAHLTGSKFLVSGPELKRASGIGGQLQGYLPHRWPKWWQPEFIRFENRPFGPFAQSMPITRSGDVVIVPTPGHTPDHVSVIVSGDPSFFLAGDTSYTERLLVEGKVDGVSPDVNVSRATMNRIVALAAQRPLVYLPSHDPDAAERLASQTALAC